MHRLITAAGVADAPVVDVSYSLQFFGPKIASRYFSFSIFATDISGTHENSIQLFSVDTICKIKKKKKEKTFVFI